MVIAWLFFASTGILFARYYKFIFPEVKFNGVAFWFFVHRIFMIIVPTISVVSFIIILDQLKWRWVSNEKTIEFTHSIFGILAICFSVIQVIMSKV